MLPAHEYANDLILFAALIGGLRLLRVKRRKWPVSPALCVQQTGRDGWKKPLGARLFSATTRSLSVTGKRPRAVSACQILTGQGSQCLAGGQCQQ